MRRRRFLARRRRQSPHPDGWTVTGCPCDFCAAVDRHFRRLDGDKVPAMPTFGPGARHGTASTAAKGCTCAPCRLARTAYGIERRAHSPARQEAG